jgi:nitroreductase
MEMMEAIRQRQSIREYEDRPVPEDVLRRVLEAARLSPSASNRQDRKFVVVRDEERRRKLSQAAFGQAHVAAAPVVIVAVGTYPEYVMACGMASLPINVAIAVDHITLAAADEGLGTCWIGAFDQDQARAAVGVPDKYTIAALLPLGFPKTTPERKPRKPLDEVVCWEAFSE